MPRRLARHFLLVEEGGFEPPKRIATDLQSAPFGHSGTPPYELVGAGGRTRTPDRLITNQLLYQLSYTSTQLVHSECYFIRRRWICQEKKQPFLKKQGRGWYQVTDMDRPAAGYAAGASGGMVPPVRPGTVRSGTGTVRALPVPAYRQRRGELE